MSTTRLIPLTLSFIWLAIMILQSQKIINFGKKKMDLSWALYFLVMFIVLIAIDYLTHYLITIYKYIYPVLLVQAVVFNLAIIFDWYSYSQVVNRVEHILGTLTMCFVVLGLFEYFKKIRALSINLKLLLLIGVTTIFSVLNEIVELFFDYFFKTKNVGPGLLDTNIDLLMNSVAIVFFCVLYFQFHLYKLLD